LRISRNHNTSHFSGDRLRLPQPDAHFAQHRALAFVEV
jgi:hypothetical protein